MKPLGKDDQQETPDLGIGYLSTAIRKNGHNVSMLLLTNKMNDNEFVEYLEKCMPDIIGMKVFGSSVTYTKHTIKLIKKYSNKIIIVIGGPQPSGSPESILDYIPADFAFHGEAEIGFPLLLDNLKENKNDFKMIPGLIWKKNNETKINPPAMVEDINTIQFPSWDLMNPNEYSKLPFGGIYRGFPVAPIIFTRGCPFRCTFCAAGTVNGYKVRQRTSENIIKEIKLLVENYGVKEITVFDSNCAFDRNLIMDVCKTLIEEKFNIHWTCPNGVRLNSLDEKLLTMMKRSGCYRINVGIESGSPRILKLIKKNLTVDQIKNKVELIKKSGISAVGFFMIGIPEETRKDIQMSINLAKELDLFRAHFSIYTPLPGTELFNQLKNDGRIGNINWDSLDFRTFENTFSELSPTELRKLQKRLFLSYHLHPKRLFRILAQISSTENLYMILKSLFQFFRT